MKETKFDTPLCDKSEQGQVVPSERQVLISEKSVNRSRVEYEADKLYMSSEMHLLIQGAKLEESIPYSSGTLLYKN